MVSIKLQSQLQNLIFPVREQAQDEPGVNSARGIAPETTQWAWILAGGNQQCDASPGDMGHPQELQQRAGLWQHAPDPWGRPLREWSQWKSCACWQQAVGKAMNQVFWRLGAAQLHWGEAAERSLRGVERMGSIPWISPCSSFATTGKPWDYAVMNNVLPLPKGDARREVCPLVCLWKHQNPLGLRTYLAVQTTKPYPWANRRMLNMKHIWQNMWLPISQAAGDVIFPCICHVPVTHGCLSLSEGCLKALPCPAETWPGLLHLQTHTFSWDCSSQREDLELPSDDFLIH